MQRETGKLYRYIGKNPPEVGFPAPLITLSTNTGSLTATSLNIKLFIDCRVKCAIMRDVEMDFSLPRLNSQERILTCRLRCDETSQASVHHTLYSFIVSLLSTIILCVIW